MANAEDTKLTLSAALLAPLNSLFEAQIHSARSFISFILQMGFPHRETREDLDALEKKQGLTPEEQDKIKTLQERFSMEKEYEDLAVKDEADLSEEDKKRKRELERRLAEIRRRESYIYHQEFTYIDSQGDPHTVMVPNLALIPIKPLAITNADFELFMQITDVEEYNTIRPSAHASPTRPWHLIEPKRFVGKIASGEKFTTTSSIKINVKVAETPMPQGLDSLLISLTQNAHIKDKYP